MKVPVATAARQQTAAVPAARSLSRRAFLRTAGAGVSTLLLAGPWPRIVVAAEPRSLSLHNTHTQQELSLTYRAGALYIPEALDQLAYFLRDHRTGDVHPIDPSLFDLLHEVHTTTSSRAIFQVVSGYRSPATNKMLRVNRPGVAKHSLHMQGKAIDVRLTDVTTRQLRNAAVALRRGGVGYYPRSKFVHLDVGRVRRW